MSRNRSLFALALTLGLAARLPAAEDPLLVAPTEALSPQEQQKLFRLPPGFEIQLVAAEPEVQKPMNLAFDGAGRLWATQSIEYPWPATADAKPRDTLRIYDRIGPNGKAGRVQVFADGLNIPIGVMPTAGGALAHSIPTINRLTDSDGDGKADRREVLFGDIGFRDTHGMASSFTPWIDGWVYACHGYNNDSTVRGADDKPDQAPGPGRQSRPVCGASQRLRRFRRSWKRGWWAGARGRRRGANRSCGGRHPPTRPATRPQITRGGRTRAHKPSRSFVLSLARSFSLPLSPSLSLSLSHTHT